MILWGFLGQVNSAPFLWVTSGRLPEKLFNCKIFFPFITGLKQFGCDES